MRTDFIKDRSISTPLSQTAAAGDVVAAAAHREHSARVVGETNCFLDVGGAGTPHDDCGSPVDHRVPDAARCGIAIIALGQDRTANAGFQAVQHFARDYGHATRELCQLDLHVILQ
jgi:hypothetical protein